MIQEFRKEYGKGIVSTKVFPSSIIMIKFDNNNGISTMELKRIFCEKYGYEVKGSSVLRNTSTYFFEPNC